MVEIHVEGAPHKALESQCRAGFRRLFERAGLPARKIRVVSGGSRSETFKDFCEALDSCGRESAIFLLVDSEGPVGAESEPWAFLLSRDQDRWEKPGAAADNSAHLMVQCMESWFLADPMALQDFFGQRFRQASLRAGSNLESISARDVVNCLKRASKDCKKGPYDKGDHSFGIIGMLDPRKLEQCSPHAQRLFTALRQTTQ